MKYRQIVLRTYKITLSHRYNETYCPQNVSLKYIFLWEETYEAPIDNYLRKLKPRKQDMGLPSQMEIFRETMDLFCSVSQSCILLISLFCFSVSITTSIFWQAEVGGPLMSFDGNFIGLNYYHHKETPFIPSFIVLKCLQQLKLFRYAHLSFPFSFGTRQAYSLV